MVQREHRLAVKIGGVETTVRVTPLEMYVNRQPVELFVDNSDREIVIHDDGDPDRLVMRAVLAGAHYVGARADKLVVRADGDSMECPLCGRSYRSRSRGWMRRHLVERHRVNLLRVKWE